VALEEEIIVANNYKDCHKETDLSQYVRFSLKDRGDKEAIRATLIPERGLMDFMISTCVNTKERAIELFPVDGPGDWDEVGFPGITRKVFADTIGDLVSVWLWIWDR